MRNPVRHVTLRKSFESRVLGCRMDVRRSRITSGENKKAAAIKTGTSAISHRRQNHSKYSAATAVAIHTPRVSASKSPSELTNATKIHTHSRFGATRAKNRYDTNMI